MRRQNGDHTSREKFRLGTRLIYLFVLGYGHVSCYGSWQQLARPCTTQSVISLNRAKCKDAEERFLSDLGGKE